MSDPLNIVDGVAAQAACILTMMTDHTAQSDKARIRPSHIADFDLPHKGES